jgi:hypothetical protein
VAASSNRTFADVLMALSGVPFILWSAVLGAVIGFGWPKLDLTTGLAFFVGGAFAYLILLLVGGGSAIWAIRHARALVSPLHRGTRRLVGVTGFLLLFPWILFGVLCAW